MAFLARVSAAVALALAAAEAAASGGCAAADGEGDEVGLLQSAGQRARAVQPEAASGGWVAKAALCGAGDVKCGSGCCESQDTCNSDQMCEFLGATKPPTPGEVGCPIAFEDLGDGGCCPAGLLLGPPESCVQRTCENILQYNCGVASGGAPTCTDGGELPAGVSAGLTVTVNGAAVAPTVSQTCTLDGKSCYKYSVDADGMNVSNGAAAPDCEEGAGAGLLQSAGQRARAVQPASGGWVAKAALCGAGDVKCGSGCCEPQDTCNSDQMCEFLGATKPPTPGKVGCPIAFEDLGDDGCCPAGLLLGPPESCVQRTCENILQYNCSVASGGAPTCTDGGELPAGVSAGLTVNVNGAAVAPTVSQTCTLDGKSCYKYSVDADGMKVSNGAAAPDCEAA